jgi:energy-coupling factor transporter ATP-binding protein EcfA2
MRVLYNDKRFLAAGPRIAQGRRYQPDLDDIYFPDDEEPPRYYINTFQPEDVPKAIKGDVSIAYKMMESICRNTPSAVQKLMTIAAKHAQFPALMPKYGVLMTGQQGSGKSTLARLIGLALSKRYNSAKVNLDISFNSEWRGFACKEWPEFDRNMGEEFLKDLITGEDYIVSVKYGMDFKEKNHTLNIFTCNGLQSKIQEGDRRFLVVGDAKADDKKLGLEFEAWVNGMGPNHFRYHLLNDIDCSNYDLLNVWTEMKDAVIDASKSYKSTVKDYVIEELEQVEGLECPPNVVVQLLLDAHKVPIISFNKEFGQYFIKPALEKVKIDGFPQRFRAFKNHEKWRNETSTEEYVKQFRLAQKLLNRSKI